MRLKALIVLAPFALLLAACGSSASTNSTSTPASGETAKSSAMLSTRTLPGVGAILVNAQGRTLYTFAPDKAQKMTCTGSCAMYWPPLTISSGKASVAGGVHASMVGSDPNPAGTGRVVTYKGWPLYLYVADQTAGTARGQALNSSGGFWYTISPSGSVIAKKARSASTSTSTSTTSAYRGY